MAKKGKAPGKPEGETHVKDKPFSRSEAAKNAWAKNREKILAGIRRAAAERKKKA